jgi:NADPH:quinone reductase-like Zn-dependent oxidoreductase
MKAAVGRSFGPPDVVTVADVPRPEPRGDEILVRVRAAAVGVVDGLARRGSPWYARPISACCGRGFRCWAATSPGRWRRPGPR